MGRATAPYFVSAKARRVEHTVQRQSEYLGDFLRTGLPSRCFTDDTDDRRDTVARNGVEAIEQAEEFDGSRIQPHFFTGFTKRGGNRKRLAGLGATSR